METGKVINKISNRLRRRSKKIQESIGISGAKGNILNYILVESENHPVYQKEIEEELGEPSADGDKDGEEERKEFLRIAEKMLRNLE